jgi:cytidine deaminase
VVKRKPSDAELIKRAKKARQNAYSPYSKVRIGAAVLTSDGKIFAGCNIENSSFGLSNCAERTAVFKAVSEGHKKLEAIAIVGESEDFTRPCGACRQVLVEFGPEMRVIRRGADGFSSDLSIAELLPEAFKPTFLTKK